MYEIDATKMGQYYQVMLSLPVWFDSKGSVGIPEKVDNSEHLLI